MKKLLLLLSLSACIIIFGCTRNLPEGALPQADSPQNAAEIYVLRSTDGVFWALLPLNITFDNYIVARLGTGEYVRFDANYGFHDIGISDQTIQFPFERGKTYYFLAAPDGSSFGFGISRLGDAQGQHLIKIYKDVSK